MYKNVTNIEDEGGRDIFQSIFLFSYNIFMYIIIKHYKKRSYNRDKIYMCVRIVKERNE